MVHLSHHQTEAGQSNLQLFITTDLYISMTGQLPNQQWLNGCSLCLLPSFFTLHH